VGLRDTSRSGELGVLSGQDEAILRYTRWVDLLDDLSAGLADGRCPARLERWAAPELL